MVFRRKRHYPATVDEYVRLATRAGWQPSTVANCRVHLHQYHRWLRERFQMDILEAGAREFIEFRKCLLVRPISKGAVKATLQNVASFYLLKAQNGDGLQWLALYNQVRPLCRVGGRCSTTQSYKPFPRETLQRIVEAARSYRRFKRWNTWVDSEDYEIIMTLLYTGGRAQLYGLRVDEVDFEKGEIRTRVKGGVTATIPLHPTLAAVLSSHLETRKYQSEFLFQHGRDSSEWKGFMSNRKHALVACKRVQAVAGLAESVHPYRFRKTLAVLGRQLGLDITQVQRILGHQNVQTTINVYATPDLEELKRAFATIDLTPETRRRGRPSGLVSISSESLSAPPGAEHGWNLIVSGLEGLLAGSSAVSAQEADVHRAPGHPRNRQPRGTPEATR